jgi:prepilin-type N-terminal cleavage/methylation domain-containing protein
MNDWGRAAARPRGLGSLVPRPSSLARLRGRQGFTLLELLTVMTIMVLLMGTGVAGYMGIRRGAEMRGAVSSLRTALMLARQEAVTKRTQTVVKFARAVPPDYLTNSFQIVSGGGSVTNHPLAFLPPAIEFDPSKNPCPPPDIRFYPKGDAGGVGQTTINLIERQNVGKKRQTATITVYNLTGLSTVEMQ